MLGLKNEEYSPKMFFLLTRKLYLKLTKFLAILLLEFVSKRIVTKPLVSNRLVSKKQTFHLKCIIIWCCKKIQVIFCWSVTSCLFFDQLIYLYEANK